MARACSGVTGACVGGGGADAGHLGALVGGRTRSQRRDERPTMPSSLVTEPMRQKRTPARHAGRAARAYKRDAEQRIHRDRTERGRCRRRGRRTRARRSSNHPAPASAFGVSRSSARYCRSRPMHVGGVRACRQCRRRAPAGQPCQRVGERPRGSRTGRCGSAPRTDPAGSPPDRHRRRAAATPAPGCRGSWTSCGRPSRSCRRAHSGVRIAAPPLRIRRAPPRTRGAGRSGRCRRPGCRSPCPVG